MANFDEELSKLNNTKDTTVEFAQNDIDENKVFAILAYISWLVLIPIFCAKNSKFARFHANQGLVLAISGIVVSLCLGVLADIPLLGWIFSVLGGLVGIACFILAVLGIINAVQGRAKELPFIGKFRILKY